MQQEKEELDREAQLWVERQGDSQALAEKLQAELNETRQQLADLKAELEARSQPAVVVPMIKLPDLEVMAAEVLASLKLGRQAPGYQGAKKAIAQLVKRVDETTS